MENRVIRPYEQGDEVRLGWLESNAVSVSPSLLEMTGFFDSCGDLSVFDGEKVVEARDARQVVFYPPRRKDLSMQYEWLVRILHMIKTSANTSYQDINDLQTEIENIMADATLTQDEKENRVSRRQADIMSHKQNLKAQLRYHNNVDWSFNSLIEKLASNTVETVINEHSSRKYEEVERAVERIRRFEEG